MTLKSPCESGRVTLNALNRFNGIHTNDSLQAVAATKPVSTSGHRRNPRLNRRFRYLQIATFLQSDGATAQKIRF